MLKHLEQVRASCPLSIHGVGLSIGGEGPLDLSHLDRLAGLLRRFEPRWFSEHLAWSSHGGHWFNDLLPLSYDASALQRVCDHVDQAQAHLGRQLLLENPSTYLRHASSTMDEATFVREVVRRTGCGVLLDVNNARVSGVNHATDPWQLIAGLPADAIGEIHLAGCAEDGDAAGDRLLIDHHGAPVDAAVWALYERTIAWLGPVPTVIERDQHVPAFGVLEAEARRALEVQHRAARHRGWHEQARPLPSAHPGARRAESRQVSACHDAAVVGSLGRYPPDRSATAAPSPMGVFAAALLDPRLPTPAGLDAWNGSDPAARFAVYRNNVMHSLVSVLGDTFPVVRQVVGTAFFDAMARAFVRQVLPRSPLMHRYGEPFADWLAGFEPAAGLPWLADLARLEFARLQALHAADAEPLAPQALAHALADPEGLAAATLRLHPSLRVLCSAHAAVSLWSAHQQDDVQRDERLSRMALDVPEAALVCRPADEVLVIPLTPPDAALVAAWAAGCPLGASLASGGGADVAGLLALLLTHGAVVGLSSPSPGSLIDPQPSEALP